MNANIFKTMLAQLAFTLLFSNFVAATCDTLPFVGGNITIDFNGNTIYRQNVDYTMDGTAGASFCTLLENPVSRQTANISALVTSADSLPALYDGYYTGNPVYNHVCRCSNVFSSTTSITADCPDDGRGLPSIVFGGSISNPLIGSNYCCRVYIQMAPTFKVEFERDTDVVDVSVDLILNGTKRSCSTSANGRPYTCDFGHLVTITPHLTAQVQETVLVTDLRTKKQTREKKSDWNGFHEGNPNKLGYFQKHEDGSIFMPTGAPNSIFTVNTGAAPCPFTPFDLEVTLPIIPERTRNIKDVPFLKTGMVFGDGYYTNYIGTDYFGSLVYSELVEHPGVSIANPTSGQDFPCDNFAYEQAGVCTNSGARVALFPLNTFRYPYRPALAFSGSCVRIVWCSIDNSTIFNGAQCTAQPMPFGATYYDVDAPNGYFPPTGLNFNPQSTCATQNCGGSQNQLKWKCPTNLWPGVSRAYRIDKISRASSPILPAPSSGTIDVKVYYDGFIVESTVNTPLPRIKSVDISGGNVAVTAYSLSTTGPCMISTMPNIVPAVSIFLKTTPETFELPPSLDQYKGDLNVTVICGTATVSKTITVDFSNNGVASVVVDSSPINWSPSSNDITSYAWKSAIILAVIIAIVLVALYFINCRKKVVRPKITLK